MLKLPIFQPGEIDDPAQMFRCEFYKCTIAAGICIARQRHRYKQRIGGGAGASRTELRVSKEFGYCASGKCGQGNTIAAGLKDYKPESEEEKKDQKRSKATAAGVAMVAAIEKKLETPAAAGELRDEVAEAVLAIREKELAPDFNTWLAKKNRPKREKKMPRSAFADVSDDDIRKTYDELGGNVHALAKKFGSAWSSARAQCIRLGLSQGKPRSVADVAKKHNGAARPRKARAALPPTAAANDDPILSMLQGKRAELQHQVDRLDKAIEALSA